MGDKNSIAKALWTLTNRKVQPQKMADGGLPGLQYRGPDGQLAEAATEDELGRLYDASGNLVGHNSKFENERYGAWSSPEGQPTLDWLGAKAYDYGQGAYNLVGNLVGAVTPIGTSAEGNMAFQVPPMIPAVGEAFGRLMGTPSNPGTMYSLTGVPELDKPVLDDTNTAVMSMFGGNAFNPLAAVPKGAVASGAIREAALPMDAASRMARARELGFDVDTPLYHGTDKSFDAFKVGSPGHNSTVFGSEPTTRSAVFVAEHPDLAREFADQGGRSGNVMELLSNVKNPLDVSKHGFVDLPDAFFDKNGLNRRYYDALQPWETWRAFDDAEGGRDFVNALKNEGYDAARITDVSSGDVQNTTSMAIFDPVNLRSVDAAFDPARAGENGLLLSDTGKPSLMGSAIAGAEDAAAPIRAYHAMDGELEGGRFDLSRAGSGANAGNVEDALFFTTHPDTADTYLPAYYRRGGEGEPEVVRDYKSGSNIVPVDIDPSAFDVWDMGGAGYRPGQMNSILEDARSDGAKGVILENYRDPGVSGVGAGKKQSTIAVFGQGQGTVKSPLTGETLFSDTGKPNIMGAALATAGNQSPQVQAALKVARELDSHGFYSPSLEASKVIPQEVGTVGQMKSMLLKNGAKPKELEALSFDEAFPDPNAKVNRQDIEDFLRGNRVELGRSGYSAGDPRLDAEFGALSDRYRADPDSLSGAEYDRYQDLQNLLDHRAEPKFESYSTPGGIPGSYRETIATLPNSISALEKSRREAAAAQFKPRLDEIRRELDTNWDGPNRIALLQEESDLLKQSWDAALAAVPDPSPYTSSHWPGITNPLLHYRTKDFPGVEGSKTRVLDEMQSDWAQRARDAGTRDPSAIGALKSEHDAAVAARDGLKDQVRQYLADKGWDHTQTNAGYNRTQLNVAAANDPAAASLLRDYDLAADKALDLSNKLSAANKGVPPAPFISNTSDWTDLGLKHALLDAARDPAVDRLAWAPGKVQADRYGLHKVADRVQISELLRNADGSMGREIDLHNRSGVIASGRIAPDGTILKGYDAFRGGEGKHISEFVGKELAQKLLQNETPLELKGAQIAEFGGEGMKGYYDKIIPQRLQKLLKGIDPDARVGDPFELPTGKPRTIAQMLEADGLPVNAENIAKYGPIYDAEKAKGYSSANYPSIPITPAIRQRLLDEGLSLFADQKPSILGSALATAGDLPMDHASRMARAREMGFDTEAPVYHGARDVIHPFESFDIGRAGTGTDGGWFGEGIYTSPLKGLAEQYAGDVGHTRELFGRMENPFDWNANTSHAVDTLRSAGVDIKDGRSIAEYLRSIGHDGVNVTNPGASRISEKVYFEPKQLRDVNAAFDPARAGENGLLLSDTGKPSLLGSALATAGDLPMDYASRMARAKELGFDTDKTWYHGTNRLDRLLEKPGLDPKRATSGPMPFFTDDPAIASNYATGKADTSLPDDVRVQDYFNISPKDVGLKRLRMPMGVEQSWNYLTPEQRAEIMSKIKRVGYEDLDAFDGPLMLHPEGVDASLNGSHLDDLVKRNRGNPLAALREMWLEGGALYDDPSELADIWKLAGYPHPISQTAAPWFTAPGVMPAHLKMSNPLNTANVEDVRSILPQLRAAIKGDRTRLQEYGADNWDKTSRYTPRSWVDQLESDLASGENSYVWTSIPDKITDALRGLGYDGILDTGGKMGGVGHSVAVPFAPNQVRSVKAAFNPANIDKAGLLLSDTGKPSISGAAIATAGDVAPTRLTEPTPLRMIYGPGAKPGTHDLEWYPTSSKGRISEGLEDGLSLDEIRLRFGDQIADAIQSRSGEPHPLASDSFILKDAAALPKLDRSALMATAARADAANAKSGIPYRTGQPLSAQAFHGMSGELEGGKFRAPDGVSGNWRDADYPVPQEGVWATSNPESAHKYADKAADRRGDAGAPAIVPTTYEFQNPYVLNGREFHRNGFDQETFPDFGLIAEAGHDGVVIPRVDGEQFRGRKTYDFAALRPGTVKSPLTGETLFSDTGKPSILGTAVATGGEQKGLKPFSESAVSSTDLTREGSGAVTQPPALRAYEGDAFDWSNPGGPDAKGSHARTAKIGDTTVLYGVGKDNTAEIISVRTPSGKRGKGSARAALSKFISEADARGLALKLQASPLDKKTGTNGLVKFYETLGFRPSGKTINSAGDPEMVRAPMSDKE